MKQFVLFFLVCMAIGLCAFAPSSNVRLVLIGVAMNQAEQPLSGVNVQLEDMATKQVQTFLTNLDGHFYFKLQGDKSYRVSLIDANQQTSDIKLVSTINKNNPEIIHLILKGDAQAKESLVVNRAGFATVAQPSRAKANGK
ncbi:MAG: hypothetical protein IPL33_09395 [Sphingobacteriales bacterium]|nr:hypothetical protein [Sphingobacteriales bacterium]